ncbi:hypothetical protein [Candidatus Endomicrobiellum agilis]|uniref:hypothetical protein n=1 Tax=Candidatus Endomicrobiellum agilis TaxID=3238957 RepID=UPI003587B536|nr:hypothetical protein [Endomicrobium sp.]
MVKKLTLVLCSVFLFLFPTLSLAGEQLGKFKEGSFIFTPCSHCHHCCPCCPSYQASIKKLDDLLTKYEKAADDKKDAIKKDIEKNVVELLAKKIEKKKEKIAKLQKFVSDYETKKDEIVHDKVDYLTSDKGRKKIHKQKAKIDKHNEKKK